MAIYTPAIAACEEFGEYAESWSFDGVSADVTLRVPWELRHALVTDLLANNRAWPHGIISGGPTAQTCAIRPFPSAYTTSGQSCEYIDALVAIHYGMDEPKEPSGGDPDEIGEFYSEEIEQITEMRSLDPSGFRWAGPTGSTGATGDSLREGQGVGELVHTMNLVRKYFQVSFPLPAAVLSLSGTSNEDAYTSVMLGLTFPAQTLLYSPPHLSHSIKTDGSRSANLTFRFSEKKSGWNRFWNPDKERYENIYSKKSKQVYRPYPPADFSAFLW